MYCVKEMIVWGVFYFGLNFWFEAIYKNLRIVHKIRLHMKLLVAYGLGQMQTTPSIVLSQASSKEKKKKKPFEVVGQMPIIISNRQPL